MRKRAGVLFLGESLLSLAWFLVRVIPKPSRAAYPCQRAAAPMASAAVLWLLTVAGVRPLCRKARREWWQCRWLRAGFWSTLAIAAAAIVLVKTPVLPARAGLTAVHGPLGVGRGIHPGRVVWVHAPDATDWAGFKSSETWWQTNHTDLAVVEDMMSQAICGVAGETTDAAAWDAIFRSFNQAHGHGSRGYQAGEKIAIKINLTTCNGADSCGGLSA